MLNWQFGTDSATVCFLGEWSEGKRNGLGAFQEMSVEFSYDGMWKDDKPAAVAQKLVTKLPPEGLMLDPLDLNLPTIVVEALSEENVLVRLCVCVCVCVCV